DADEADPKVIELFERHQKMARAAGEAVELPDQHAVDLAVPGGRHQGIELGAALPAPGTLRRRSNPAPHRGLRVPRSRAGRHTAGPASGRRSRPAGTGRRVSRAATSRADVCVQQGIPLRTLNRYPLSHSNPTPSAAVLARPFPDT